MRLNFVMHLILNSKNYIDLDIYSKNLNVIFYLGF